MSIYAEFTTTGGSVSGTTQYGQKSIAIYDSATNLPTNGNGAIVTYTQNINGTVTTGTVTIPGLSYPIYTGELSDSATGFFTQFTILSITSGGTVNPVADDLALVTIVTTPASAIGASDGTVKIIATSSFPAIQYSLNGTTWQTNPLFTGQHGGIGMGYAKDANGGEVSGPYTVDFLGKLLITDPTVDLGNGNISRWNAAFNPIWFKFQRKDFEITAITAGAGGIQLNVNADLTGVTARKQNTVVTPLGTFVESTTPGDMVYISSSLYEGTFEVLAVSTGSMTVNCPWTANDTLGFVNINSLKPYYQVQLVISYVDPATGKMATINTAYSATPTGFIEADLSYFLQSLLSARDLSNYTAVNYRDKQLSASYTVKYKETWTGSAAGYASIATPYYVTYSAKQLGDKWGGNLAEYVPYLLNFQPAKWLTDFANPVYTQGFPFDLSFLFSEYMVGTSPFYTVELLDINHNPLDTQTVGNAFLLDQDLGYQITQDGGRFIIADQALSSVPLAESVGLNRLLVNFALASNCYYLRIGIYYTASGVTYPLLSPLVVRVNQDTTDRQVYLKWIGLNGGWEYYCFAYNQSESLDVTGMTSVKRFVKDWENEDTLEDVISKNAVRKMALYGENISVADIRALQGLKTSPKVQMLVSAPGQIPKWQTVIVQQGSFAEYDTMNEAGSFGVTVAMASRNLQYQ